MVWALQDPHDRRDQAEQAEQSTPHPGGHRQRGRALGEGGDEQHERGDRRDDQQDDGGPEGAPSAELAFGVLVQGSVERDDHANSADPGNQLS